MGKAAMQSEGVKDMTGIIYCQEVMPSSDKVIAKLGLARVRSISRESKTESKFEMSETTKALPAMQKKEGAKKFDYNTWIKDRQESRNKDWKLNVLDRAADAKHPPHEEFVCVYTGRPHVQLFSHDVVEEYAQNNTTIASKNIQQAARLTNEKNMFAPCMVGSLESQFLKMQCMLLNCRRVLDVGTFTGMSAIAMAEGCLLGSGMRTLMCDKFRENRDKPSSGAAAASQLAEDILPKKSSTNAMEMCLWRFRLWTSARLDVTRSSLTLAERSICGWDKRRM